MNLANVFYAAIEAVKTPYHVYKTIFNSAAEGMMKVDGLSERSAKICAGGLMAAAGAIILLPPTPLWISALSIGVLLPFGARTALYLMKGEKSPFEQIYAKNKNGFDPAP